MRERIKMKVKIKIYETVNKNKNTFSIWGSNLSKRECKWN